MQGQPVAPRTGLGPVQWILIGLGVVLLICCVFALTAGQGITNLFQGNAPPPSNLNPVRSSPVPQNPSSQNLGDVELGQVMTARQIGVDNAPQDVTSEFSTNDRMVYVVAEAKRIPPGTTIFARWSREGVSSINTDPIRADRTYENTYIEFHVQRVDGGPLEPGSYLVQLVVNGNPGPQVSFSVR